ncbi:DUF4234 domain-containing protein [Motilimonas pumila]|uniref:DUF4234 domain-containing protein n=1 Tax=Motilimonas pumila TaxID=2303987 RepID=A0A418YBM7_9GAMM|nr:DUF4234 domain-containing protein [Motilimonas pumila]RJG41859.1 DUF4234 domain-containing protein [Motilimonas pumila]
MEQINRLKCLSTWKLFFLSIITLGIYTAHYARQQSKIIDELDHDLPAIGQTYVSLLFWLSCISATTAVLSIIDDTNLGLTMVDSLLSLSVNILMLVWAFKARNRINQALGAMPKNWYWFHGFWTFLFSPLYINYKINSVSEGFEAEQDQESENHTQSF